VSASLQLCLPNLKLRTGCGDYSYHSKSASSFPRTATGSDFVAARLAMRHGVIFVPPCLLCIEKQ
jgi:hypothetical protein